MTTAGVTGNRGKVEVAQEDAFVELPVGFTEGSVCVDVMQSGCSPQMLMPSSC